MIQVVHSSWESLLPTLSNGSVAAVITDPPFGINYSNNLTSKRKEVLAGDAVEFSYSPFAIECFRLLRNNSAFFAFSCWSEYPKHFPEVKAAGFQMKEPLICQKRPSGKTDLYGSFQSNSDWVIFAHKGRFRFRKTALVRNKKAGTVPNPGRKPVPEFKTRFPSCWFGDEFPESSENPTFQKKTGFLHPTIKTVEFMEWLILMSTDPGDLVLDPFMGSGTTAEAAKRTSRRFVGCEVDPTFHQYCQQRLAA